MTAQQKELLTKILDGWKLRVAWGHRITISKNDEIKKVQKGVFESLLSRGLIVGQKTMIPFVREYTIYDKGQK